MTVRDKKKILGRGKKFFWDPNLSCSPKAQSLNTKHLKVVLNGKNYSAMLSFSTDLQWASPLKTKQCRSQWPMRLTGDFVQDKHSFVLYQLTGFAFCQKTT